jgi:hypothetical protein
MEVYPITAISPSTEVCIEYLPLITSIRSERQRALQSSFGFTSCLCALCVAPIEVVEKSDERRREIKSLSEGLRDGRKDRKGTMVKMERIRVLLEEEGYKGLPEFGEFCFACDARLWSDGVLRQYVPSARRGCLPIERLRCVRIDA